MRVMSFFTQLWVAAFVVFAGSAFVSLGFEFQGDLFELIYWSAAAAATCAIGYAILSKMFSAAFGLVSLGIVGEFLLGAVVVASVLYFAPMVAPAVGAFVLYVAPIVAPAVGAFLLSIVPMAAAVVAPAVLSAPLVSNAAIIGAIGSGLVLAIRALCVDGALTKGFSPQSK